MKKPFMIIGAVVAALLVVGAGVWMGLSRTSLEADTTGPAATSHSHVPAAGEHVHDEPAVSESAAPPATIKATVPGDIVQGANPDDPAVQAAESTAHGFVENYGIIAFDDPAPADWIGRTAPFATPELVESLNAEFGSGTANMADIREAQSVFTNSPLELKVLSGPNDGTLVFSAHYDQNVSSKQSKGIVKLGSQDKMMTLTMVDGQWKVSAFGPLLGGGA